MLKKSLIVVFILIAAVLAFATTKPDTFHIQRSVAINASSEKIFPIINDHHRWNEWSPWEKLDPAMKKPYSGAASGKGAIFEWEGNSDAGSGRNEIIESIPSTKITMKLDMLKPFEGHNTVEFTLKPEGNSTQVTWAMHGSQPFLGKVMSLFFNCDKIVGGQFEEGLAKLKALSEK